MLSLDDEELTAERLVVSQPPTGRSFSFRPLLKVLVIAVLGGALGTVGYFVSELDTRQVIAWLDIADTQPRLTLEIPALEGAKPPPAAPAGQPGSGLLTPPNAPPLPPVAAIPPPPPPPVFGDAAGPAPAAAPPVPALPVAPLPALAAPATPNPAVEPVQPLPRNAEQAPTYASLPTPMAEPKPLPPAPAEGLMRLGPNGPMPVISRDGRQPWQVYARPFDAPPALPRMAVVVTGLGLDKDATEAAITKLPPMVTLAFSPYAGGLDKWVKRAREFGHEVMLGLPVETAGFPARDPGPLGLLVSNAPEENLSRLEKVLARAQGYVGVWAPEGTFVGSPQLSPILMALKERGLLYVGDGAKGDGLPPVAGVTTSLELDLFRDAIESRLNQAAATAKEQGRGLVMIVPRPVVFDRLVGWLVKLEDQGIALAPASAVTKQAGKP